LDKSLVDNTEWIASHEDNTALDTASLVDSIGSVTSKVEFKALSK